MLFTARQELDDTLDSTSESGFALALLVALRARDVPRGEAKTLPGAVLRQFVRRPLEFFYPPRDAGPPEATAH